MAANVLPPVAADASFQYWLSYSRALLCAEKRTRNPARTFRLKARQLLHCADSRFLDDETRDAFLNNFRH